MVLRGHDYPARLRAAAAEDAAGTWARSDAVLRTAMPGHDVRVTFELEWGKERRTYCAGGALGFVRTNVLFRLSQS